MDGGWTIIREPTAEERAWAEEHGIRARELTVRETGGRTYIGEGYDLNRFFDFLTSLVDSYVAPK